MQDWDRAIPVLREALSMAPGEPTASALLASILTTTPDPTGAGPQEALAVLDRARADPAWTSQYRLLRGIALAYLRRDAEAAPLLEGAADGGPAAAYALAAVRARQGRGADAKALVAQADALVAETPSDPAIELRYLREMAEGAMSGEGGR
jgi:hypothetical protein